MKGNYLIHETMYQDARAAGWDGWGGKKRLDNPALVSRFFELKGLPDSKRLLELGCGEGHHCRAFALSGYEVTGVDISLTAIEWAREKAANTGIKGTFISTDLTDSALSLVGDYPVIIDGNCLHCIIGEDRVTFLMNVYNLLSREGVFFVSSLCTKGHESDLMKKEGLPYRHISSANDLLLELEHAGFNPLQTKIYERETHNHITIHAIKRVE